MKECQYDISAYEHIPGVIPQSAYHSTEDYHKELFKRLEKEKKKKELIVNYYRIYQRFSFPLPVRDWQRSIPKNIAEIKDYPFSTWLLWSLRERWDTFLAAALLYHDGEALKLLQTELEAAFEWECYSDGGGTSLGTAHFALCVYRYLASGIFQTETADRFREKAGRFLDRAFFPWFTDFHDQDHSDPFRFICNINTILVFSGLALADLISHPQAAQIHETAEEMLSILAGSKSWAEPLTEAAAYDAFSFDPITEYLEKSGQFSEFLTKCKGDFSDMLDSFIYSGLPGRVDLLAPIGDTEPEMTFYFLLLLRFARWYGSAPAMDCFLKANPGRIPAYAIFDYLISPPSIAPAPFQRRWSQNATTAVVRSGFSEDSLLCAVSIGRCPMGHLHWDNGSFVIGFKGKFYITDPGYQQYISGAEREFTLNPCAHNVPVINGISQTRRKVWISCVEEDHIQLELTGCYDGLPDGAQIWRDIVLNAAANQITVNDRFVNLPGAEIAHYFTINTYLAWSFPEGQIHLSDGETVLHISSNTPFQSSCSFRAPGSRGPVTAAHQAQIPDSSTSGQVEFLFRFFQ